MTGAGRGQVLVPLSDAAAGGAGVGRYSAFSPGHLFLLQQRERQVLALLARAGVRSLRSMRILEIGTGTGAWLRDFIRWGARPEHLAGVEPLAAPAAEARRLCPRGVRIVRGSAAALELEDESFDLVLQSLVFTSILDRGLRRIVAGEMRRVVRPTGLILWYDFHANNPRNPAVRGVGRREIRALFPDATVVLRRTTLAPPLARRLAARSWLLCCCLEKIPLLCTHYLGVIRKRAAAGGERVARGAAPAGVAAGGGAR